MCYFQPVLTFWLFLSRFLAGCRREDEPLPGLDERHAESCVHRRFFPKRVAYGLGLAYTDFGGFVRPRVSVSVRECYNIVLFSREVTSMMRLVVPSLALLAMSVGTMATCADLKSGLEAGKRPGAFQVKACTGQYKGKSLCYI